MVVRVGVSTHTAACLWDVMRCDQPIRCCRHSTAHAVADFVEKPRGLEGREKNRRYEEATERTSFFFIASCFVVQIESIVTKVKNRRKERDGRIP
jgi:hypothetical protein